MNASTNSEGALDTVRVWCNYQGRKRPFPVEWMTVWYHWPLFSGNEYVLVLYATMPYTIQGLPALIWRPQDQDTGSGGTCKGVCGNLSRRQCRGNEDCAKSSGLAALLPNNQ